MARFLRKRLQLYYKKIQTDKKKFWEYLMEKEFLKRLISSIILIPLTIFVVIEGSFFFNLFLLSCFLISIYEWHKMSKNRSYNIFGFLFLIFSFYTALEMINYDGDNKYFVLILLICVFTDLGGYIFGKIFKGPKLTKISPNKTYSGVVGSFFLPLLLIILLINSNLIFLTLKKISFEFIFFILLISLISQIGDIIISYFKRLSKIKNTGKILPGHGGLLDRIDGMIFAFPAAYIVLYLIY